MKSLLKSSVKQHAGDQTIAVPIPMPMPTGHHMRENQVACAYVFQRKTTTPLLIVRMNLKKHAPLIVRMNICKHVPVETSLLKSSVRQNPNAMV